jgi:HSP20 family molecular chaperone IbpA
MSDNLTTRQPTDVQKARETAEYVLRPPVEILENADGITLHLDMPGVSRERLSVQADANTLTIEGDVAITLPDGMEALFAEVQATHYRRSFTLSGELDADKTEANLRDGVLTVRIPRRAELRPRKVQVSVA